MTPQEWIETKINNPTQHMREVLVIKGPTGNGKSVAAQRIADAVGEPDLFVAPGTLYRCLFNSGWIGSKLITIEYPNNTDWEKIKQLITNEEIELSTKGQESGLIRNKLGVIALMQGDNINHVRGRRVVVTTPEEVFGILRDIDKPKLPKNWLEPDTDDPLTSIAISLKRIADNMERVEITGEPLGEILGEHDPDAPDYYLARIDELAKGGLRK